MDSRLKRGCECASPTDEFHGWHCSVVDGACMYLMPDSKACARDYGEGPDAIDGRETEEGAP